MEIIRGNSFKKIADYVFDESGFRKTEIENDIPIFFVKTDYIDQFFNEIILPRRFKIITHNGDTNITKVYEKYLNHPSLIRWFGQNINFIHDKLYSIPIGIANEMWEHGNLSDISNEINLHPSKDRLIYSNFEINTNFLERNKCISSLKKNNIILSEKCNFKTYLSNLNHSYFSICPEGNGIDTHRIWESLYLKTVPIVTKSINIEFYKNYPILIIDDWNSFDLKDITVELYNEIIKKYDEKLLDITCLYDKIIKS